MFLEVGWGGNQPHPLFHLCLLWKTKSTVHTCTIITVVLNYVKDKNYVYCEIMVMMFRWISK